MGGGKNFVLSCKHFQRVLAEALVDDHRRPTAYVDTPLVHRRIQIHSEVDQKGNQLKHRRHDSPAAGSAHRDAHAVAPIDHGRAHVGKRPLARRHGVGDSRPRIEPHDAVVHENSGPRQHDLGTEHRQQRLGERHHVACAIHHAQMGGAASALIDIAHLFQALGVAHRETFCVGRVGRRVR